MAFTACRLVTRSLLLSRRSWAPAAIWKAFIKKKVMKRYILGQLLTLTYQRPLISPLSPGGKLSI